MAVEGTRRGEALGLQARDGDVAGLGVEIERGVDKTGRVGLPKDGERRTVDLHSRLVPVLKRAIRERKEEALQRGEPWEDAAALFTTRTGQWLAAQMGHSTAATTLRFYARWLPKKDRRYGELLLGLPAGEPEAVAAPGSRDGEGCGRRLTL